MRGSFLVLETNYVERELSKIILQLNHPGSGCEGITTTADQSCGMHVCRKQFLVDPVARTRMM